MKQVATVTIGAEILLLLHVVNGENLSVSPVRPHGATVSSQGETAEKNN